MPLLCQGFEDQVECSSRGNACRGTGTDAVDIHPGFPAAPLTSKQQDDMSRDMDVLSSHLSESDSSHGFKLASKSFFNFANLLLRSVPRVRYTESHLHDI